MIRAVGMGKFMIKVYHAGYAKIPVPDIKRGRVNADFGQGFYLSDNYDFASLWVREKNRADISVNSYELDESGLNILRFDRDEKWFRYVFSNRRSMPDSYADFDIIIGPIANDTIYNTLGIMTSGYLTDDEAMKLLCIGPCYQQITLKTLKAAEHLKFLSSEVLGSADLEKNRKIIETEEKAYLTEFAKVMEELS